MKKGMVVKRAFTSPRGAKRRSKDSSSHLTQTTSIPRISRLVAMAIQFEQHIDAGVVSDQAELAKLGRVSRARMTQILNLLNLAPEIQAELLCLSQASSEKSKVCERPLRALVRTINWSKQIRLWRAVSLPPSEFGRDKTNARP